MNKDTSTPDGQADTASFSPNDAYFMARAIQLAKKGLYTTHPNPRVGCVLVNQHKIIGEGWHKRAGSPHAEINALADAARQHGESIASATVYVTLEPCSHTGKTPPCSQALIAAGVKKVVIAMQDPNPLVAGNGIRQLRAAGIECQVGLMEQQARALNPGFIKRMEQGLPWISIKLAMSLDGRTAMANGESQWITSPAARQDVQFLRAKSSAILTGAGTVLADNPSLNVRLEPDELASSHPIRQPTRIILDSTLKTPANAHVFNASGPIMLFAHTVDEAKKAALEAKGATIITLSPTPSGTLPLRQVCQELAKHDTNEIHVEAGATLCGALMQEELVDELILYMAPHLMGSQACGLLNLPGLEQMSQRMHLDIKDIRAIGSDWRIMAYPSQAS